MAQRLSAVFRDPCVQWTTGRYRHPPNTAEMGRSILAWGSLHERTEHLSGADLLAISPDVFGRPTKRADLLNRAIMLIFRLHKRPRCRQHKSPSEGEQVVAKTCSASCGGMRTPTRGRRLLRTHTHAPPSDAPPGGVHTARMTRLAVHRTGAPRAPYLHPRRTPPLASEVHGDVLSRTPHRWEAVGRRCVRALNGNGWDKSLFLWSRKPRRTIVNLRHRTSTGTLRQDEQRKTGHLLH